MSEYIHRSHNVTVLIYHLVFPAKYRRAVFDDHADKVVKEVCLDIEKRYQLKFLEIGTDKDHVHFLVQSVPTHNLCGYPASPRARSSYSMWNPFKNIFYGLNSAGLIESSMD